MIKSFPFYPQQSSLSCGLTCLKIVAKYYKRIVDITVYYKNLSPKGLSIFDLCQTAEDIGFRAYAYDLVTVQPMFISY